MTPPYRVAVTLLAVIIVSAVLYLAGAFAAADFNIANWDALGRYLIAVVWPFVLAGTSVAAWEASA